MSQFLLLNGVVLALVIFYLLRRRPKTRMKLTFKPSSNSKSNQENKEVEAERPALDQKSSLLSSAKTSTPSTPNSGYNRSLNVIFNYNGHSWDAYEVLGIPAGSSIDTINEAYETCLVKVDAPSRTFIETAYRAILKNLQC